MRQIAIRLDMGGGPQRQQERVAVQADDSRAAGSNIAFCAPAKENGFGRAMASDRIRQTGSMATNGTYTCHGAQSHSGTKGALPAAPINQTNTASDSAE